MRIRLLNEIRTGEELEVMDQHYEGTLTEKNGFLYFLYENEENEKVMLKCGPEELTMTRYSNPKTVMRFLAADDAIVVIPTPLGLQHFVTTTHHYQYLPNQQKIELHYHLKDLDKVSTFAEYEMEISWSE